MGLSRLVLFLVFFAAGYWLWRKLAASSKPKQPPSTSEHMVRCDHCDLYLSQEEATHKNQRWYCCAEHAQQGN